MKKHKAFAPIHFYIPSSTSRYSLLGQAHQPLDQRESRQELLSDERKLVRIVMDFTIGVVYALLEERWALG